MDGVHYVTEAIVKEENNMGDVKCVCVRFCVCGPWRTQKSSGQRGINTMLPHLVTVRTLWSSRAAHSGVETSHKLYEQ